MIRIYLLRHGETVWNKEGRFQGQIDTELSENGKNQAKLLAAALQNVKFDEIYSSPLQRAFETANESKKAANFAKEIIKISEFSEISHGSWEGKLAAEIKQIDGERLNAWHKSPEKVLMPDGGESLAMVSERVLAKFGEIAAKNDGKTIAIFAHDAINKVILCDILGVPLSNFWRIKQDNTCINIIEIDGDNKSVLAMNNCSHCGFLASEKVQAAL